MIPWPWLVVAFGVGSLFGVFLMALVAVNRPDDRP